MRHRHTGLPGIVERLFGDGLLRGLIILIDAVLPAGHHEHPRLIVADNPGKPFPVVLGFPGIVGNRYVQPHHQQVAIFPGSEFVQLGGDKVLVGGPFLGMLGGLVVGPYAFGRETLPPVIVVVPVGNGEIGPRPDVTLAEGLEDFLCDVGPGVGVESTALVGHFIIGLTGVEHTESVVVLSGEHDVLHSGIAGGIGPFSGIEGDRIERIFQFLIGTDIVEVIHLPFHPGLVLPGNVIGSQRPRLDHTPLAVCAPVDKHPELQVLPLCKPFLDILLHRRNILRARPDGGEQQHCDK